MQQGEPPSTLDSSVPPSVLSSEAPSVSHPPPIAAVESPARVQGVLAHCCPQSDLLIPSPLCPVSTTAACLTSHTIGLLMVLHMNTVVSKSFILSITECVCNSKGKRNACTNKTIPGTVHCFKVSCVTANKKKREILRLGGWGCGAHSILFLSLKLLLMFAVVYVISPSPPQSRRSSRTEAI